MNDHTIYTTLNKIRAFSPCKAGWEKLLYSLGKTTADDEPLKFSHILDSNGLNDALWCCRTVEGHDREWRLFAVWCAQQVQHLNPDPRVADAIQAAEDFANCYITDAARDAAWAAAVAAARDAAVTSHAAAARAAAWAAARDAAWAAAGAAARDAAWAAAVAAAGAAAGAVDNQSKVFRWIVDGGLALFEGK